ncbi:hypothetical protein, conserved [Trypanosoma brucei gambiense DAL972]|uniref:Uncharacterized protein n=1 Tax=Trypanosoma brucei gambiense (strain MHOM/CI/86/DAL972) TaxID=679716 RepID=C9ZKG3_TRYB9|nr:hypothetical protein, conserved [Trypanosoma brucei gambiense DAL972]CBH09929.1 hypothetical protein, conserved [Trypanosoma brucei gambiense DAL972]|eukprot:XP_011772220.1 hypothetical protein, conserved [Trypanosoma brucei gambiense DAL972]
MKAEGQLFFMSYFCFNSLLTLLTECRTPTCVSFVFCLFRLIRASTPFLSPIALEEGWIVRWTHRRKKQMLQLSTSYLQRLQRLYAHFKQNLHTLLGGCCTAVELLDEDDLTNWFVQLRYEDENKKEFIVSLRVLFLEELQRMPLVFVVSPRLFATFIHYGAICSFELMSQQWTVDVEGLSLLFHSLYTTLNPFGCDSRVTVDESRRWLVGNGAHGGNDDAAWMPQQSAASAYSLEEHDLGIQHIRNSHPHLFRSKVTGQKRIPEANQLATREGLSAAATAVTNDEGQRSSAITSDDGIEGDSGTTRREKVVCSCGELQQMRFSSEVMDIFLDTPRRRALFQSPEHPTKDTVVDDDMFVCNLPSTSGALRENLSFNILLAPLCAREGMLNPPLDNNANPTVNSPAFGSSAGAGECKTDAAETMENEVLSRLAEEGRDEVAPVICTCAASEGEAGEESNSVGEGGSGGTGINCAFCNKKKTCECAPIRLVLCGEGGSGVESFLTSIRWSSTTEQCVIPPDCTLRLQKLEVYASVITVLGTLEVDSCIVTGNIVVEGQGQVIFSRSKLFVDVPDGYREGILVLDESKLDLRDGTVMKRYAPPSVDCQDTGFTGVASLNVLHSFIHVSNSARLCARGGCSIAPSECERVILAEQDASVDISDCDIMAGYINAVSVAGCRAFFAGTRFYGGDQVVFEASDGNRPTGLSVELGGLVTARHCLAEYVYFGFSVISHSVAHFYSCHAEHVVNGYTVEASRATFDSSSAFTNHVGIFALNGAKCTINNDAGPPELFEKRCRTLLALRGRENGWYRLPLMNTCGSGGDNESNAVFTVEGGELRYDMGRGWRGVHKSALPLAVDEVEQENDYVSSIIRAFSKKRRGSGTTKSKGNKANNSNDCEGVATEANTETLLPLSFVGGAFGLEVREATVVARGLILKDTGITSIFAYDKSSIELTDVIVMSTLPASRKTCAVRIVNSSATLSRCLVTDHSLGFTASQGSVVLCRECVGVCRSNSFVFDGAECRLYSCGAYAEQVGVLVFNQSKLSIDNSDAPHCILGGIPCIFQCRIRGLDSRSSHVRCVGVTVRGSLESGFTSHNGGYLCLKKCMVDMSDDPFHGCTASVAPPDLPGEPQSTESPVYAPVITCSSVSVDGGCGVCRDLDETATTSPTCLCGGTWSLGVKAWAGSHCELTACEVRHVTFGYAALDADTEMEAWQCVASDVANGYLVDSAKCCLNHCTTECNHVGVLVLNQGTCIVHHGSYRARVCGIENRNGIVQVEGNVKISGFSRSGVHVNCGARFDATVDSLLEVSVSGDFGACRLSGPLGPATTCSSLCGQPPSCFVMDKGTAVIHNAVFGGGAAIAVRCGVEAVAYLYRCKAEFCNVAFNALVGSNVYLSDCLAQNVWNYSLLVSHGGAIRVTASRVFSRFSSVKNVFSVLQGNVRIFGKCVLDNTVLHLNGDAAAAADMAPQSLELDGVLEQVGCPIRVYEGGQLSMNSCYVIVQETQAAQLNVLEEDKCDCGHKCPTVRAAIFAKGSNAYVRLRNVLLQCVPTPCLANKAGLSRGTSSGHVPRATDSFKPGEIGQLHSKVIWHTLVLHSGARGEVCGAADVVPPMHNKNMTFFFHRSTSEGATHSGRLPSREESRRPAAAVAGVPRDDVRYRTSAADIDIGPRQNGGCPLNEESDQQAPKPTKRSDSDTPILPVRLHVTDGSSLVLENVRVRQLSVAMDSRVAATRCVFAGSEAVSVVSDSSLEATRSVFISAVGGPALQAECAKVSLTGCSGYCIYKEIIIARHATVTLKNSVLHAIASSTAAHGGIQSPTTSIPWSDLPWCADNQPWDYGNEGKHSRSGPIQGLDISSFTLAAVQCGHSTQFGSCGSCYEALGGCEVSGCVRLQGGTNHEGELRNFSSGFASPRLMEVKSPVEPSFMNHNAGQTIRPSLHASEQPALHQRTSVRLEDSHLRLCLRTRIEGAVVADAASHTRVSRPPQPWRVVCLLRDVSVNISVIISNKLVSAVKFLQWPLKRE